jgi:hypothetical protein
MKTLLAITCGLVLGAAAGVFGTRLYYQKALFEETLASIRQTGEQSVTMATLNLAVLEQLEAGQQERTKSLLARQVASFYRTFHDFQPMLPETRKLMDHIQATSEKSPSLKEALNAAPR